MGLLDDAKKAIGLGQAKKMNTKTEKKVKKSAKDIATEKGEPWVSVLDFEIDPANPGSGAFELDWNEHFIKLLWKNGYRDDDENDVVDRWFQDVCRHVVMESFEKDEAMVTKNDLGDGRTEYK
jgi:hypothetical protein